MDEKIIDEMFWWTKWISFSIFGLKIPESELGINDEKKPCCRLNNSSLKHQHQDYSKWNENSVSITSLIRFILSGVCDAFMNIVPRKNYLLFRCLHIKKKVNKFFCSFSATISYALLTHWGVLKANHSHSYSYSMLKRLE